MSKSSIASIAIVALFALFPLSTRNQSKSAVAIVPKTVYADSLRLLVLKTKALRTVIKEETKNKTINTNKLSKNG